MSTMEEFFKNFVKTNDEKYTKLKEKCEEDFITTNSYFVRRIQEQDDQVQILREIAEKNAKKIQEQDDQIEILREIVNISKERNSLRYELSQGVCEDEHEIQN